MAFMLMGWWVELFKTHIRIMWLQIQARRTSRALMWCTCVTLETVKEMHKQGDPLPPTDSLCFDSGSFFPSHIHHLMYVTLLGVRRAPVFSDSEQVRFVLPLNSTTFILHGLQWASHRSQKLLLSLWNPTWQKCNTTTRSHSSSLRHSTITSISYLRVLILRAYSWKWIILLLLAKQFSFLSVQWRRHSSDISGSLFIQVHHACKRHTNKSKYQ